MKADLHVHTSCSDGRYSPEQIIQLANQKNIEVLSITDHDSVSGIESAIVESHKCRSLFFVPGVEISTVSSDNEIHILGYFVDFKELRLCERLSQLSLSRKTRAARMVANLKSLGLEIELSRLNSIAGEGNLGRPHLAQAMLEKGYVSSFKEAFDRYIGRDKPAYVEREKITPEEAIDLIMNAKGVAVLAHPAEVTQLDNHLSALKKSGLTGVEVWYKDYSSETVDTLLKRARKFDLIATGGSDYHGLDECDKLETIGNIDIPSVYVDKLFQAAGKTLDAVGI